MTSSFDTIAHKYDETFTFTQTGKYQRERVWNYLDKLNLNNKDVSALEINCGTGEDAVYLASRFQSVVATDLSSEMIRIAIEKSKEKKISTIDFFATDMLEIRKKLPDRKFDMIFSNFGGLNCLSDDQVQNLSSELKSMSNPGGNLILVIMGRKCLWEKIYFILKGKTSSINRRKIRSGVNANVGTTYQKTYYYSPKEIQNHFSESWNFMRVIPIGLFLPPSYLDPFFSKHLWLLKLLRSAEKIFGRFSFCADYADHYLIHFTRKEIMNGK